VIDLLLVTLSVALGASAVLLSPSPWMLVATGASVGLLLAALLFRRTGFLVACGALLSVCILSAYLSMPGERLWHALVWGVGLLVLLDAGWDRIRLVQARLDARAYAPRLSALGRAAALSFASVFVAVTLGYGTALEYGLTLPFPVAVGIAALAGGGVAALILGTLGRRR
jgi:hypothetical protein